MTMGSGRRRAGLILTAASTLAASIGAFTPAVKTHAQLTCPTIGGVALTLSATKSVTPPGGNPFIVCNGRVPTFDGTPIDMDVSIPASFSTAAPLMLFMSGWSNDICQFESTTFGGVADGGTAVPLCGDYIGKPGYHWNNAWFASQGFITLNYTPRGWYDSCGKIALGNAQYPQYPSGYNFATDTACSSTVGEKSWVHLYDRRWEIHDAQYLSGLLVDAGLVNAQKIIPTGDSGGGGPSWDLALSNDQVMLTSCTDPTGLDPTCYTPWVSPGTNHTPVHVVGAFPIYTWTDLVDALATNGTASDGFNGAPPDGNHLSPIGVEKQSYTAGLFALGAADAQYSAPLNDPTSDLQTWNTQTNAGEPYASNPVIQAELTQIGSAFRSPFYMPIPAPAHQVPIYSIQGDTDPLFPATQTLSMINRLKVAYPNYPVYAFIGDVGHSYAQNPIQDWHDARDLGNAILTEILNNQTITQPPVTLDTTNCVAGHTIQQYTAPQNFGQIATSQLTFNSAASQVSFSSNGASSEGTRTEPIANSGCRSMVASQSDPNQASYTFMVPSAATLVGGPVVNVTDQVPGSSAELAARLWDLDPAGNQTLITRTVYRFEEGANGSTIVPLAFQLWPNGWQLQCGHSIKLELSQNDQPVWRPDNQQSAMLFSGMQLSLPVVPGSSCTPGQNVAESPLTPMLPVAALLAVAGTAYARRRRLKTDA